MQELMDARAGVNAPSCVFTSSRSIDLLPWARAVALVTCTADPALPISWHELCCSGLSAAGLCSCLAVC